MNQVVYNLERRGMHAADRIIAVSAFTKNKIVDHYGIDPNKVEGPEGFNQDGCR